MFDEFNLLQKLHLYTEKSIGATITRPLVKLLESFFYNFHRKHSLLKLKIKSYCEKLVLKIYQMEFRFAKVYNFIGIA